MINVLLLREPSEDAPDRYESAFAGAGYHPVSIAVLETVHTNISSLRDLIQGGPKAKGLSGVVITSKRSCDAWREALQLLRDRDRMTEFNSLVGWCSIPFYVVGQATATALTNTFAAFEDLGLRSVDVRGQSSGNAASLAPFILDDLKERPTKLLYLTGDKNRDTLPRLLNEGGISLESVQVYKTQGSATFEATLSSALASTKDAKHWWIIYFAPSAAVFVTPILRKHFQLEELDSASITCNSLPTKVAAIGPSTNSFLHDDLRIRVHAMAQKPTPEEIVSVITISDNDNP
ncbi:tetrapyrrole biosynthesis, uroporphyrinogen III synthase [Flammula alnicola]|nr:tetrapyrrole biosynthesis, uroporphyrinogen III synthase [Flammula alnicola]